MFSNNNLILINRQNILIKLCDNPLLDYYKNNLFLFNENIINNAKNIINPYLFNINKFNTKFLIRSKYFYNTFSYLFIFIIIGIFYYKNKNEILIQTKNFIKNTKIFFIIIILFLIIFFTLNQIYCINEWLKYVANINKIIIEKNKFQETIKKIKILSNLNKDIEINKLEIESNGIINFIYCINTFDFNFLNYKINETIYCINQFIELDLTNQLDYYGQDKKYYLPIYDNNGLYINVVSPFVKYAEYNNVIYVNNNLLIDSIYLAQTIGISLLKNLKFTPFKNIYQYETYLDFLNNDNNEINTLIIIKENPNFDISNLIFNRIYVFFIT